MEKKTFEAVRIADRVWWVGAIDWNLRDFHGYATPRGSTYNAYLVVGDTVTLVDTVKAPFRDEMLARIASVLDPKQIRCIVSNHSEMDHTGCLGDVIDLVKPERVVASDMGAKALAEHFHWSHVVTPVKDGESLSLGNLTLRFMETRMLHWPDSMVTHVAEERVLFSQDAFGMHLASNERFADEIPSDVIEYEAAKYFANILMPFSARVPKLVEKIRHQGLDAYVIAPDHGPVWRRDQNVILERYLTWAMHKPALKAVVVFDTMWGSTELMARAICDGLLEGGATVSCMPLRTKDRSEVATEVLDAGALLVGSPTLNDGLFPTVADILAYLKGLKPRNLVGAAFGSFGWNGTAVEEIKSVLSDMKVALVGDEFKLKYVPDATALAGCRALGLAVAAKLKETCAATE